MVQATKNLVLVYTCTPVLIISDGLCIGFEFSTQINPARKSVIIFTEIIYKGILKRSVENCQIYVSTCTR